MDFKAWKDRVWKASTRIKAYLKVFFSKLLKGKLGKNTLHGPNALSEASHQMLCTEASLSSTARSRGLAHTTLPRKLQRVSRDEVWAALSSVMDSMLGVKENPLIADFDFIFTSLAPEENLGTFYDVFNNYPLLAAWATPTDPVVREYANLGNKIAGGAGATISDEEAWKSLAGMWLLSVYNGIQFKTPPEAFWTGKFSQYVYYPRDVIRDRSGTCIDAALLFASLAMAQGLRSYIVLMPGHAFTLVVLPTSGNIIPIETTALNAQVPFEEAVKIGVEVFREALSGPHIIVDIEGFQAMGIHPPELEPLPPDILERWGIKTPVSPPREAS